MFGGRRATGSFSTSRIIISFASDDVGWTDTTSDTDAETLRLPSSSAVQPLPPTTLQTPVSSDEPLRSEMIYKHIRLLSIHTSFCKIESVFG